jgi:CheY-like chemotaxis protein
MEEELQKMETLESIGVLAGGIAHDLNNFLTGIVGHIGLARLDDDPAEKDKRLEYAENDAMQIQDLTRQLLTFSKGGTPVTTISDLSDLLRETVNFTLSGSNVVCDFALPDGACPAEIDEGQIRQVINNLVINAQQAMPGGGTISVSAETIELDKRDGLPLDAGSYVRTSVEDEGVGIAEEDRKRIFDPFFSTKPTGSGLGLASSFSIVKKHGGLITVESELGVGTRFDIYLPASLGELAGRKDKEEAESLAGDDRILVMDDQENIRDIVDMSLSKLGYDVVTCEDGAETVEKYKDAMGSGNPFSAVILDLTIPGGMGGLEAIGKLKELDPGVRAIVASGYSADPIMTACRDYGFRGAIVKPYRIKGLREVLDEVLNES